MKVILKKSKLIFKTTTTLTMTKGYDGWGYVNESGEIENVSFVRAYFTVNLNNVKSIRLKDGYRIRSVLTNDKGIGNPATKIIQETPDNYREVTNLTGAKKYLFVNFIKYGSGDMQNDDLSEIATIEYY